MNRYLTPFLIAVLLTAGFRTTCIATDVSPPAASQVKAAMIFNLAKFIDWPAEVFPSGNTPFMICLIGKSALGPALETLAGKAVKGRRVIVRHVSRSDDFNTCHSLVIGESELRRIPAILDHTGRRPVVTISDLPGFAGAGGIIGLVEQEGKIRFEINLEIARQSNIRISPQLIRLAHIVGWMDR